MAKTDREWTNHGVGKASLFEALYAAHHRTVLSYCARRAGRTDAWDAAAEVFVVAWRRLDEIPNGEAVAWLLGVAYKVLANQRRSELRRRRLTERAARGGIAEDAMPEAQLIRNEEEAEVVEALARLRPVDREILQLSLWEELPPVQVAAVLGISRAAVDQRYSRAKRRLAKQLRTPSRWTGRATQLQAREGGVP